MWKEELVLKFIGLVLGFQAQVQIDMWHTCMHWGNMDHTSILGLYEAFI